MLRESVDELPAPPTTRHLLSDIQHAIRHFISLKPRHHPPKQPTTTTAQLVPPPLLLDPLVPPSVFQEKAVEQLVEPSGADRTPECTPVATAPHPFPSPEKAAEDRLRAYPPSEAPSVLLIRKSVGESIDLEAKQAECTKEVVDIPACYHSNVPPAIPC